MDNINSSDADIAENFNDEMREYAASAVSNGIALEERVSAIEGVKTLTKCVLTVSPHLDEDNRERTLKRLVLTHTELLGGLLPLLKPGKTVDAALLGERIAVVRAALMALLGLGRSPSVSWEHQVELATAVDQITKPASDLARRLLNWRQHEYQWLESALVDLAFEVILLVSLATTFLVEVDDMVNQIVWRAGPA
ncbi:hypothetical protein ABDK56_10060 [Sphingomonas sp. ASV193]|uniref:hypothetical protein n=1 Tax=Sphingomonas sp. ASV193 TaxID=3144405 RepID=UPI0032E92E92